MQYMLGSFQEWRDTIPFTNEQIANALEQDLALIQKAGHKTERYRAMIDRVRKGHLSRAIMGLALPILVKHCAICGKKALYRIGPYGRCSDHRDISEPFVERKKALCEIKGASISMVRKEHDYIDLSRRKGAKRTGFEPGTKRRRHT